MAFENYIKIVVVDNLSGEANKLFAKMKYLELFIYCKN